MAAISRVLAGVGLSILVATASHASRVVIPTDFSTVQLGVDSGADTVALRDSIALERVTVARSVVLEPVKVIPPYGERESVPQLQSLEIVPDPGSAVNQKVRVRGIRFRGTVRLASSANGPFEFSGCRFDSSLVDAVGMEPGRAVNLRGCMIFGSITIASGYVQVADCTVVGGRAYLAASGLHDVRDNLFLDSPQEGLAFYSDASLGPVSGNTIRRAEDGIRIVRGFGTTVSENEIEDVRGHGIAYEPTGYSGLARARSNIVRRCAGDGIHMGTDWSPAILAGNEIEDAGGDGIRADGFAIGNPVEKNRVLRCAGAGLRLATVNIVRDNVVGRCGGDGIVTTGAVSTVESNTSYANGGAGIAISGDGASSVQLNIAALNTGAGMAWTVSGSPVLECNDWYSNSGGAVTGVAPGGTDVFVDPLFCDLPGDDVRLSSTSPLVSLASCDTAGALGVGCTGTVSSGPPAEAERGSFVAWPMPATGAVRFRIPMTTTPLELEVYDASGARRWKTTVVAGSREAVWEGRDAGGERVPAGVYFARLRRGSGVEAEARVVLIR